MRQIHPTAVVDSKAELADGVVIGPYCVVGPDVRIGEGTRLLGHVFLDGHATIGRECTIFPFASIGTQTQDLKYRGAVTDVRIGDRTTLREYVTVNSSTNEGEVTAVGENCHIMAYCHVAHQCTVGNRVIMSNSAMLAGHVIVEDDAIVSGLTGVHQFVRIGRMCMVGGCSKITQDCPPFMIVDGNPATVHGLNAVGLKRHNVSAEATAELKKAYRILYRDGLVVGDAVKAIREQIAGVPEVDHLVAFVEKSERGIVK